MLRTGSLVPREQNLGSMSFNGSIWEPLEMPRHRDNSVQPHSVRAVYVYNKTRETVVATQAIVADGYFNRLVGLLGKTRRWGHPGAGLWIVPCHGVHTIGMLFPIDLVFLNKEKQVVHVDEMLYPFSVSRLSFKATSVLELPPHTICRTGTRIGDRLEIA
jgi:uncharacterized membrane protein (UPF0127 family)